MNKTQLPNLDCPYSKASLEPYWSNNGCITVVLHHPSTAFMAVGMRSECGQIAAYRLQINRISISFSPK